MAKKEVEKNEADEDILVVKEVKQIPDGEHNGHITNVIRNNEGEYDYIDVFIELEDMKDVSLKTGFPSRLSEKSHLGLFLKNAGFEFAPNQEVSIKAMKDILIGRNVEFNTYTKNNFARVVNDTIRFV